MRIPTLAISLALLAGGCTHAQLERSTLNQGTTLADLQYKQVLDNLAAFVGNAAALPYFALTSTGQTQVADQGEGTFSLSWMEPFTNGQTLGMTASRQLTESWSLSSVLDADKLARMRCAYQLVVGVPDNECDKCMHKLCEIYGKDIMDPVFLACHFPRGWFSVGCKKDVPKCACCIGRHCNTYVWVTPDGLDGLTRFTLTILNLAAASPASSSVVTTYEPPTGEPPDPKFGKASRIEVTSSVTLNPCDPSAPAAPAVRRDIPRPLSITVPPPQGR
jgi:hypothetical protein